MKNLLLLVVTAAAATTAFARNDNIVGGQTANADNDYFILMQDSTIPFGPHKAGKAGIGVSNSFFGINSAVDFEGMSKSKKVDHTHLEGTTVHSFENPIPDEGNPWWKFHKDLGVFNFVQVGSGDVWIGEWAKNSGNGKNIRQAYYVGDKSGTTLPAKGTIAKYNTYGINNFNGSNLLQGELTADFDNYKLSGELTGGGKKLELKSVDINVADASFSGANGAAKMSGQEGTVSGHFFGAQAAALAGVADFGSHKNLNTAFGGTKK